MEPVTTEHPDVLMLRPTLRRDERGEVRFMWNAAECRATGLPYRFRLENHIRSHRWVLRGLHRQQRYPQGKLVRCLKGRVFDVGVDLRPDSARFGEWVGRELDGEQGEALWLPAGFAHGFLALTEGALVSIQADARAVSEDERTLAWDDATVSVKWPLPSGVAPTVNARDASGMPLSRFR